MKIVIIICAFLLGCSVIQSPPPAPLPDKAVFHYKRDTLSFTKAKKSSLLFKIVTTNPINGDICEIEGQAGPVIVDSEYIWNDSESTCMIKLKFDPQSVQMNYTQDCHSYCGLNSALADEYYEMNPVCQKSELSKTKKNITKFLHEKNYLEAIDSYSKLLEVCGPFMDLTEVNSMLNDKALSQWRANDSSGCRSTLKPIKHWAGRDDEKIPGEFSHISKLRKSINYTWKMCNIQTCAKRDPFCVD